MTMVSPAEARRATAPISGLAEYSGLEFVARLADGSIRRPPMAEMLPFTPLPPEEGKVGLLATPEPRFCNLTNTVHGGWIMTMLDTAMALAAQASARNERVNAGPRSSVDFAAAQRSAQRRPEHLPRPEDRDVEHEGDLASGAPGYSPGFRRK